MSLVAIHAERLGKQYGIARGRRRVMLREQLTNAISAGVDSIRAGFVRDGDDRPRSSSRKFWALRDVSFQITAGESVGIIGRNGAGKSTLLKILARVTTPSAGRARLRGRVGSLLEVGTGFHSELTGRENVYLNGAVLGMRHREIERKFDEIVDFSGVEEFLETPVKFYSSGMRMRLAFSVAAHLEPEILLVDEVLAVGDAAFQQKCLSKMGDVVGHGRTVLFVSHNMAAIRALCQTAIYIDQGQIAFSGEVHGAIERYLNQDGSGQSAPMEFALAPGRSAQVLSIALEDEAGALVTSIAHDQHFWARLKIVVRSPTFKSFVEVHLLDSEFNIIASVRDLDQFGTSVVAEKAGTHTYRVRFPATSLVPGGYTLRVRLVQRFRNQTWVIDEANAVWPFTIYDNGSQLSRLSIPWSGKMILPAEWQLLNNQSAAS
jgi:lipopolysaccharide transport system ATP-binding protein